jgi:AcrR family transcriptional regulator
MSKKKIRRGVSKAEWLEAALEFLARGNIDRITVEGLAKHLGIAKSGFYWHFSNRDELLQDLLEYWLHEITEVITVNKEFLAMEPRARLQKTAEMLHDYKLTRYEMAVRQWAQHDKEAARVVRKANRMRMDYLLLALSELGITGDEAEMRAMTYLCYMTWEPHTFHEITRKKRRAMIGSRVSMLTSK